MKNNSPNDHRPLCVMNIVNEDQVLQHYKIHYRFYSKQCRDNFQEHRNLYLGNRAKCLL